MYSGVQGKTSIQRWSTTRLQADPLVVGYTGPITNFQYDSRDATFESPPAVASGTLRCEGGDGEKK